jgi:hypothetical protein
MMTSMNPIINHETFMEGLELLKTILNNLCLMSLDIKIHYHPFFIHNGCLKYCLNCFLEDEP